MENFEIIKEIPIPCDLHVHSDCSFDGENTSDEMIKRALELGIEIITFTNHFDIDENRDEPFAERADKVIPPLKEKYQGKIKILYGIELGGANHNMDAAKEILQKYDYDYVLGSVHMISGFRDFYYLDYNEPINEPFFLMEKYFDEILELINCGIIDTVAHLTYPVRYIAERYKGEFNLSKFDDKIDEILKHIIEKDIALEINTKGMRTEDENITSPDFDIIKRYFDFGGRNITTGSDAHNIGELALFIPETVDKLKEIGFTELCYYEKRERKYIKIN